MTGTDYISNPTVIRVIPEEDHWAIDGAGDGGFTEAIWDWDNATDDYIATEERAHQLAPEFARVHGWEGLPIETVTL